MSLKTITDEIGKSWPHTPATDLCIKILEFIDKSPRNNLNFLTFKSFCNAVDKSYIDESLLTAINILVSSRNPLLETHAMLVDNDETEHEISSEDFSYAQATGELIHPYSGQPVENFEEHIIPFFTPTERLLRALDVE